MTEKTSYPKGIQMSGPVSPAGAQKLIYAIVTSATDDLTYIYFKRLDKQMPSYDIDEEARIKRFIYSDWWNELTSFRADPDATVRACHLRAEKMYQEKLEKLEKIKERKERKEKERC